MYELDCVHALGRFCRASTNARLVRFVVEQPPGTTFEHGGKEYRVKGYRCYLAGVWKNNMNWDRDEVIVVDENGAGHYLSRMGEEPNKK